MRNLFKFLLVATLASASLCDNIADLVNQSSKELKTLFSEMKKKLGEVETKVNQISVLDYAFKVSSIDKSLNAVVSNLYQTNEKLQSIESGVNNFEQIMQNCGGAQNLQKSISSSNSLEEASYENLMDKLDGYGKKILKAQQTLIDSDEKMQNSVNDLHNVIRTGFTKILDKLDQSINDSPAFINTVENVRIILQKSNDLTEETSEIKAIVNDINEVVSFGEGCKRGPVNMKPFERMKDIDDYMKSYTNILQILDNAFNLSIELKRKVISNETVPKQINILDNLTSMISKAKEESTPFLIIIPEKQKNLKELLQTVSILLGEDSSTSQDCESKKFKDLSSASKDDQKICEEIPGKLIEILTEIKKLKDANLNDNRSIFTKINKSAMLNNGNYKSLGEILG